MRENTTFVPFLIHTNSNRVPVKMLNFHFFFFFPDTQAYFELKVLQSSPYVGHA